MERGSSPPVSPRLHEVARRVMSFTFEQLETIGVHVWIPDEKFLSVFSSTLCSIVSTFSTTRGGAFLRAPRWLMGYFPPHTFFTHSSMARKHGARHDPAFFIYNCINPLVLILGEQRELSSISRCRVAWSFSMELFWTEERFFLFFVAESVMDIYVYRWGWNMTRKLDTLSSPYHRGIVDDASFSRAWCWSMTTFSSRILDILLERNDPDNEDSYWWERCDWKLILYKKLSRLESRNSWLCYIPVQVKVNNSFEYEFLHQMIETISVAKGKRFFFFLEFIIITRRVLFICEDILQNDTLN